MASQPEHQACVEGDGGWRGSVVGYTGSLERTSSLSFEEDFFFISIYVRGKKRRKLNLITLTGWHKSCLAFLFIFYCWVSREKRTNNEVKNTCLRLLSDWLVFIAKKKGAVMQSKGQEEEEEEEDVEEEKKLKNED